MSLDASTAPSALFLHPPAVDCVATCEVDLTSFWEAAASAAGGSPSSAAAAAAALDFECRPFDLVPTPERADAYLSGTAGWVRLTVVAGRALAALRAAA
jgi:hypothetical protein